MKRLEAIFREIPVCELFVDIGTDHGFIAREALKRAKKVIATDISEACLLKAKKLLKDEQNIEFRVGDGLKIINQPIDCVSICGMGAIRISEILSKSNLDIKKLILQPNGDTPFLREFMNKRGFSIISDTIAFENNKFYDIIAYEKGQEALDKYQLFLGKFYKDKNDLFIKRLNLMIEKTLSYKQTERNREIVELLLNAKKNYEGE